MKTPRFMGTVSDSWNGQATVTVRECGGMIGIGQVWCSPDDAEQFAHAILTAAVTARRNEDQGGPNQ